MEKSWKATVDLMLAIVGLHCRLLDMEEQTWTCTFNMFVPVKSVDNDHIRNAEHGFDHVKKKLTSDTKRVIIFVGNNVFSVKHKLI